MAGGKVDFTIAQVENIVRKLEGLVAFCILIIHHHEPRFVLVQVVSRVASRKVEVRGIGRKPEQFRVGHRHAAAHLFLGLNHLAHVVVQAGAETHFPGDFAELVVRFAHRLKAGLREVRAVGRENDHDLGVEILQEIHGGTRVGVTFWGAEPRREPDH